MNKRVIPALIPVRVSRRDRASLVFQRGWVSCALAVFLLAGCCMHPWGDRITGSGRTVTETFDLAGFSRLVVGSTFQVSVTRGDQHRVLATVDDNLVEHLDISRSGETLNIRLKPNLSVDHATLKVDVTMPDLLGLDAGGASRTTLAGFSSDKSLEAEVDGASTVRGEITSGDTRFRAAGASRIELQGGAQNLRVKASGASSVNLDRFTSNGTGVEASGASHVTVNARGNLEVRASGASSVRYVGTPASVSSQVTGASSVKQK